jgi:glycosyltransferase involved in cell wall biosynthesis
MTAPLVSVILATHEGDDLDQLTEAIDSVIAQSHRPLELLVVCDGPVSPDTEDLLSSRSRDHPWIGARTMRVRGGPAVARNAVLGVCSGDYVAVLDADDAMTPDRITTQIEYLEAHGLDVVGSWLQVVDQQGAEIGVRRFPEDWRTVRSRSAFYCPTANPSTLFRKDVLPMYRYPEHLSVGEDYRLWVHLMQRGNRIGNVPRPLTRYRTGSSYYERRTGMAYAVGDRNTKLIALSLAPWWQRPLVVVGAELTFLVRLLPTRVFRVAYRAFEGVTRGGRS